MAELHKNLKSLRRERKIDLKAIEKRTKIDIEYLKAIESGKFEVLPSTYIRLFLKAYCVEIGADPVDALHQLDELYNNGRKTIISEKEILPKKEVTDTEVESSKIESSNTGFASGSAPTSPSAGDLWFDTGDAAMKVYNGPAWDTMSNRATTDRRRSSIFS